MRSDEQIFGDLTRSILKNLDENDWKQSKLIDLGSVWLIVDNLEEKCQIKEFYVVLP